MNGKLDHATAIKSEIIEIGNQGTEQAKWPWPPPRAPHSDVSWGPILGASQIFDWLVLISSFSGVPTKAGLMC